MLYLEANDEAQATVNDFLVKITNLFEASDDDNDP